MKWLSAATVRRTGLALICAAAATPALAQQEVKIGIGFGVGFLPIYLMDEMKLVEKHAKAAGLDVKTTFSASPAPGPMQDAILSGAVDMGPTAPRRC